MKARSIAVAALLAGFAVTVAAQSPIAARAEKSAKLKGNKPKPSGPKAAEPLFRSADIIDVTIKGPINALTGGRNVPDTGLPATLTVVGSPESMAVTLAPRGITRRRRETCPFPPLWVQFTAKPPAASVFKGQKKLKLVTHCRGAESFQQYVLLEYAAYRLFNVITPISYGARLARINYVDETGKPVVSRLGFLIEDGGEVAKRNALDELKGVERIRPSQLDPRAAARFAVFEDMIGNLDWAMIAGPPASDCCHNSILLGAVGATSALVPAPYDFDFAGVVDAPYAVPPDKVNVANVRVRRYRGYCIHNAELAAVAADFNAKRPQLLATIDAVPELDPGTRAKARKYIDGFFEQIASPASIADKFEKVCL